MSDYTKAAIRTASDETTAAAAQAMVDFVSGFSGQARRAATLAATYVYNRTVRADYDGICGRDTLATDQVAAMVKSIDPKDAAAILSYIA